MVDLFTVEHLVAALATGLVGTAVCLVVVAGRLRMEKRRSAAKLEAADTLFQEIIEAAPVGICIVRERRFAFVNKAYVRLFGYDSKEEILGRFVEELYAPAERERQRSYARDRAAGKPVPTAYEIVGLKKSGQEFDVAAWVSLITYRQLPSSLGFVIDRSLEKEMSRRLDQANRLEAIGTLAGGIAHDFNNILTAIIGYGELALLRAKEQPEVASDIQQLLKAGERAKELVRQILSFSRRQGETKKVLTLATMVDEVSRLVRASLPTSIAIKVALDSEATILADPTRIHQLLMNLCANAEYAMRGSGGLLEIEVADHLAVSGLDPSLPGLTPGQYVKLTIKDSGPGIPAAIRSKIFEPFFTTKEVGEGTGMGLAQVHAIVISHGGYLSVADNSPHGALFAILFPVVHDSCEQGKALSKDILPGAGRILLVDDEEMVLNVTRRILDEFGYEVTPFQHPRQALDCFRQQPADFDLLLSDMTMPEMGGDQLARAVKEIRPDLPVILCSGYNTAWRQQPDLMELAEILEKPVEKGLMAETVGRVLAAQQQAPHVAFTRGMETGFDQQLNPT